MDDTRDDRTGNSDRLRTRRALLAAVTTGSVGLAGCLSAPTADDIGRVGASGPGEQSTTESPTGANTGLAGYGLPATICDEEIRQDPGIYAVTDPTFDNDWSGRSIDETYGSLSADTVVVGAVRGGEARAYPLPILTYHEVVNDDFDGPLLVTYCPLCGSGLVARRRVEGVPTVFHVSGLLWRAPRIRAAAAEKSGTVFGAEASDPDADVRNSGNLVMYDERTQSYWSQILARAICGPATEDDLTPVPATTATWGKWRAEHPETQVLLPPPHSETDRAEREGG